MSNGVWVCFPTANAERAEMAAEAWRRCGYRIALLTNTGQDHSFPLVDLNVNVSAYPGYWRSCNALAKAVVAIDPEFRALVCAADDMEPDPDHTADEIAYQFLDRFPDGYGVMQPTGDDLDGTDRICGSPWLGRGWIIDSYSDGPYHSGYMQFFMDEELLNVAKLEGVLWQRPDLTQYHAHWSREGKITKTDYQRANDRFWAQDKRLFEARRAEGFPA
jgi:hypothetical protein